MSGWIKYNKTVSAKANDSTLKISRIMSFAGLYPLDPVVIKMNEFAVDIE